MVNAFLNKAVFKFQTLEVSSIVWLLKKCFYAFLFINTLSYVQVGEYVWGELSVSMIDYKTIPTIVRNVLNTTIGLHNYHWVFIVIQLFFSFLAFIGVYPRLSATLVWFSSVKIFASAFLLANSSSNIATNFAFFLIFMSDTKEPSSVSKWVTNTFFVVGLIQICTIYMLSSLYKMVGDLWWGGSGLYLALNYDIFTLQSLKSISTSLSPLLLIGNYLTLLYQLLFPLLIFFKPVKKYTLVFGILFHLSILFITGIVDFSIIMIIIYVLFLDNEFCLKIRNRFNQFFADSLKQELVP